MKKLLSYVGILDGRNLTPTQQENFGKGLFLFAIVAIIVVCILVPLTINL